MSNTFEVHVERAGTDIPWGFRVQGGADSREPLTVQRVFTGSPAETSVQRGDVILQINHQTAAPMAHNEALEVIKNCGMSMTLLIQRSGGGVTQFAPPAAAPYQQQPWAGPATPHNMNALYQPHSPPGKMGPKAARSFSQPMPIVRQDSGTQRSGGGRYFPPSKGPEFGWSPSASARQQALMKQMSGGSGGGGGGPTDYVQEPEWRGTRRRVGSTDSGGHSYAPPQPIQTMTQNYPAVNLNLQSPRHTQFSAPQPRQTRSDAANSVAAHLQYNTPIGLYSRPNIDHSLEYQTAGTPAHGTLHVSGKESGPALSDYKQSHAYKLIHGDNPKGPHSVRYDDHKEQEEMRYHGYVNPGKQSRTFRALQEATGTAEDDGSYSEF